MEHPATPNTVADIRRMLIDVLCRWSIDQEIGSAEDLEYWVDDYLAEVLDA